MACLDSSWERELEEQHAVMRPSGGKCLLVTAALNGIGEGSKKQKQWEKIAVEDGRNQ